MTVRQKKINEQNEIRNAKCKRRLFKMPRYEEFYTSVDMRNPISQIAMKVYNPSILKRAIIESTIKRVKKSSFVRMIYLG